MPLFQDATVNIVPDVGHWTFQTWKIDHYCLTPFELTIAPYEICFIIRTGHRIFKWEYGRKGYLNEQGQSFEGNIPRVDWPPLQEEDV